MLAFPDMVHLFAYELPGLCGRRFPLPCVLSSAFQGFFLRHTEPPARELAS